MNTTIYIDYIIHYNNNENGENENGENENGENENDENENGENENGENENNENNIYNMNLVSPYINYYRQYFMRRERTRTRRNREDHEDREERENIWGELNIENERQIINYPILESNIETNNFNRSILISRDNISILPENNIYQELYRDNFQNIDNLSNRLINNILNSQYTTNNIVNNSAETDNHNYLYSIIIENIPDKKILTNIEYNNLTEKIVNNENIYCSICLSDKYEDITKIKKCEHKFCNCCLYKWLTEKASTCPMCRIDLKEN